MGTDLDEAAGGTRAGTVRGGRVWDVVQWVLVIASVVVSVVVPLLGTDSSMICLLLTFPFAVIHGVRRHGWRRLVTFLVISFVFSNFFEDLSIYTGFPFGNYHYVIGGKLIQVPVLVGIIYCGLGYIAWSTANVLLDRADERLDWRTRVGKLNLFGLPALSAVVMTAFDVMTDAQASTLNHTWAWEQGGGFFGVPYTNYLGWWFVTWTFFQAWALILSWSQSHGDENLVGPAPVSMMQPLLGYVSLGIGEVMLFIGQSGGSGTATDPAGVTWGVRDINETALVVGIFGLLSFALLAIFKTVRGDVGRSASKSPEYSAR